MKNRVVAAAALPLAALMLSACVSKSEYEKLARQNYQLTEEHKQLTQQNDQLHSQLAVLQAEHKWVEAGDLLFPEGGWQLSPAGKEALNELIPRPRDLKNATVTVYGYTDDTPVGPALQSQGITNNLDLSSKRAGEVVTYLASQGVDPNIMSAKGRGDTHPVAPNDTPENRAKNRRIEIVLLSPGA